MLADSDSSSPTKLHCIVNLSSHRLLQRLIARSYQFSFSLLMETVATRGTWATNAAQTFKVESQKSVTTATAVAVKKSESDANNKAVQSLGQTLTSFPHHCVVV